MNSNQKGKRFEREVAKILNQKFDTNVRRTPQSGGMSIKGDIIDINPDSPLYDFHWECKNQEKLNIWKALAQARADKPMGKIPVVVMTRNFENNYACLELDDFLNLIKTIQDYEEQLRPNSGNNRGL